jgi:acyl-CoA thioester hydrolase
MLDICVRLAYLGRSSLRFVIEVYKDQSLLTSGELVYVYVDTALGVSVALPEAQRAVVLAFEITPVELGASGLDAASVAKTKI